MAVRKAWFETKDSGLGLRPVSWEGWLLTVLLVVWVAVGFGAFARGLPHENRLAALAVWVLGAAAILVVMRARAAALRA